MAAEKNKPAEKKEVEADWESAFQAEDFMLDPEAKEAGSLFSLEEEPAPGRAPASAAVAEPVAGAGRRGKPVPPVPPSPGLLARIGACSGLSMVAGLFPAGLGKKIDALRPAVKGVFLCSLLAIFVAVAAFSASRLLLAKKADPGSQASASAPAEVPAAEPAVPAEPRLAVEAASVVEPMTAPPGEDVEAGAGAAAPVAATPAAPAVPPESLEKPAGEPDGEGYPESERRKWRFSSFMISPRAQEEGQPVSYVVVDLSLVLRLPAEDALPEDSQYRVRDMVYQFYQNRPLYELRRYALARGEMKQKLMEWLRKQWPDGPVETIVFHRYKIL